MFRENIFGKIIQFNKNPPMELVMLFDVKIGPKSLKEDKKWRLGDLIILKYCLFHKILSDKDASL